MSEHRCRSCLHYAEPLWPEHRPACMWRAYPGPPWIYGRHYVTAEAALDCKAFEDLAEEDTRLKAAHAPLVDSEGGL